MSNHPCMMSYAQGSSVGTTSTTVPECSRETPDRLVRRTVERTVTHGLPLTGRRGRNTSVTGPQQPQPQGPHEKGAESHGQDHQNHRNHRDHGGGVESPTQYRYHKGSTTGPGPQQPRGSGNPIPWGRGGWGGGRNRGPYKLGEPYIDPHRPSINPVQTLYTLCEPHINPEGL